ncbi:MAG: SDR family oxidoreductase [Oscillospiraceae bacterium]|nr:SDR family oxidoreductase [Oscillospiraceae bacterium]
MAAYLEYGIEGRTAIVTGAGTGIGAACAIELAKAGARVALLGRRTAPLQEILEQCDKYTSGSLALPVDVADEDAVNKAVKQVHEKFGRIDILVNNAGFDFDYKPGEIPFEHYYDTDKESYMRFFEVHAFGHFAMAQACTKYMVPAKFGRIVNVTSVLGVTGDYGAAAYTASKAAANLQTKSLARKYGKDNITVNSISPGMVNTPMKKNSPPEEFEAVAGMTPLGRVAEPIDIARVVMFFAQENLFVTGQNLIPDGGGTM